MAWGLREHARMRVAIVVALGLAGCGVVDAPVGTGGDDGKADGSGGSFIGYIQANTPFYWAPSDYAAFSASEASIGMPASPTPVDANDALTQRLQSWIDRIDAVVRAEVRQTTGAELVAPRPIVEILPTSSTFNAWVSPTVACTGIELAGAEAGTTARSFLQSAQITHGSGYQCVHPAYPGVDDFRTFWDRHKPACKVGADVTVGGTGCNVAVNAPAGELALFATSPYIHVTSDLIAAVSERTLAIVLAHELGHYYRAHVSDAVIQRYNFWYDSEPDRKKLPVPAANATDLQAKYAELVDGPRTVQAAVPGHYSPRFRTFLLTAIAPLLVARTEPSFACATARDALGPWTSSLLAGYGIPTDAMDAYLAFEAKLVACAPRVDLTGDPGPTALSYGSVLMAVLNAKLPAVTLPFHATLDQVLDALDAKAVKLDLKEVALVKQVQQNRIGLYTIEEEADDIALEISARLGISPDDVVASWLEFMQAIALAVPEYYRAQYQDENATCQAMLATGFTTTDASGTTTPTFVPIGDLSEPHHSDCYRLFNFWREQKLRKYTVADPIAFPDDWATMQDEAKRLSAAAAAIGQ